ncbi:methyltransferase [Caulobacter phage CcrPW]|uniref:FkbM family methyltransferase n=1 Tax=Caulobacter phage CcrPW TaxID=2283271 RepID=A0A385EAB6_9CAUD|nr:methyltransferase [Caulobacter phage CcrPW]AXQ68676.1 FkbM family methyltransferase [Caulobacter phage CcrPW]
MLISTQYQALNAQLHADIATYGAGGWQWIGPALKFAEHLGVRTILDYGCGKASFGEWTPGDYVVLPYDPVTYPGERPACGMVVCLDVMEHIEPDCLDSVLRHIRSKAERGAFFVIAMRPAQKTLADGRNAHLIVEDAKFWINKLHEHFTSTEIVNIGRPDELVVRAKV